MKLLWFLVTACGATGLTKVYARRLSSKHNITAMILGSSAPVVSREHNEGIVKAWLSKGRADPKLASTILDTGGFACWATLAQLGLERLHTNFMFAAERKRILDVCYSSDAAGNHGHEHKKHKDKHHKHKHHSKESNDTLASSSGGVMCNRQHNGLGNQMFQYVFSRLAADSLGREWTTKEIDPTNNETPYDGKGRPPNTDVIKPPNTDIGWGVFTSLFAHAAVHESPHGRDKNATFERARAVCKADFRSDDVCRMSDRPYDVRRYRKKMFDQMLDAFWRKKQCSSGCVYLAGYFQETIYFWPERKKILSWFALPDALDAFARAVAVADAQGMDKSAHKSIGDRSGGRSGDAAAAHAAAVARSKPRLPNRSPEELALQAAEAARADEAEAARKAQRKEQGGAASSSSSLSSTAMPVAPLNLSQPQSAEALEGLGMERLKKELEARKVKSGGTLQDRAERLATRLAATFNFGTRRLTFAGAPPIPAASTLTLSSARSVVAAASTAATANRNSSSLRYYPSPIQPFQQPLQQQQQRRRRRRRLSTGSSTVAAAEALAVVGPASTEGTAAAMPLPPLLASPEGFPSMEPEDMAVHVRCCEPAGMCKWLFMPWGYYEQVLSWNAKEHPAGKVWVITTPQCASKKLVSSMLSVYPQAQLLHAPDKKRVELNVANDFRFLMNSPRLLLGKSTFGFWAGYLSPVVQEVHMPIDPKALAKGYAPGEKIPFAYDDQRYVHHAWEDGKWFGRPDKVTGKVVYEVVGPKISLKQMAP